MIQQQQQQQARSASPPLPPPPASVSSGGDDHVNFGAPQGTRGGGIVPRDQDLPGWVPKNYIEKGEWAMRFRAKDIVYSL